jgi:DNA-binding CsgD family transcriptional regulator
MPNETRSVHREGDLERSHADTPSLPAPPGLCAERIVLDQIEYVVLSYPMPTYEWPQTFTRCEREVALAMLRGESSRAIAHARRTSARTVANQVAAILAKVGVASRAECAAVLVSSRRAVELAGPTRPSKGD